MIAVDDRLLLVDIDGRVAGPAPAQHVEQGAGRDELGFSRRGLLRSLAAARAAAVLCGRVWSPQKRAVLIRSIPSSGEAMPVVGLGSWITFNVGDDTVARDGCTDVIRKFVESGGRVIDSSPMYASSQDVIGYGLHKAALAGR